MLITCRVLQPAPASRTSLSRQQNNLLENDIDQPDLNDFSLHNPSIIRPKPVLHFFILSRQKPCSKSTTSGQSIFGSHLTTNWNSYLVKPTFASLALFIFFRRRRPGCLPARRPRLFQHAAQGTCYRFRENHQCRYVYLS